MTTATPARVTRRLRRGDDYTGRITIPADKDPDEFTFLAQVRVDTNPDSEVLAAFTETRAGRVVNFKLDGETDVRDLPDKCGADLQVWYRRGEDDEVKRTALVWTFVVEGDYSREAEGS